MGRASLFMSLLLFLVCTGCAGRGGETLPNSSEKAGVSAGTMSDADLLFVDDFDDLDNGQPEVQAYYDPLEPMNRMFFTFNDKLYYWVLKPLNTAYSSVVPYDFRFIVGNFMNNLSAPIRFLNNVLQGKFYDSGVVLSRFLINSTLGVYGLTDPAMLEFGLEPRPEDFGQTLGVWGVGEGIYLCWPVIGPSSMRDTIGFAADAYSHPMVYYIDDFSVSASYYAGNRLNLLSLNPDVYEDLKKYSLDPYVSMRQIYLDYRRGKVEDKAVINKSDNEL